MNGYGNFYRIYGHLSNQDVRSLAWLLTAPDLLNYGAQLWQGKVGALPVLQTQEQLLDYLTQLDRAPERLYHYLEKKSFTRLGKYAESLLAFYFSEHKVLFAHGKQLSLPSGVTLGEFDFLLYDAAGLVHGELATKFYLYTPDKLSLDVDRFVGPNLKDTLGLKMHKILDQQLMLSTHPIAKMSDLDEIVKTVGWIKGWLFYPMQFIYLPVREGLGLEHCFGFWGTLSEVILKQPENFVILPRLSWLTPAKVVRHMACQGQDLKAVLEEYLKETRAPVLVAFLKEFQNHFLEYRRIFVVPDEWVRESHKKIEG